MQSYNDLNKKYKEINKELNHLKRYYEPIEQKLLKKELSMDNVYKCVKYLTKKIIFFA